MASLQYKFIDFLVRYFLPKTLKTKRQYEKKLREAEQQGNVPYVPDFKNFHVDHSMKNIAGMDCYFLNTNGKNNAIAVYFHGGGYINQPVKQHWQLVDRIAYNTGTEIWAPIYPKVPFCNAAQAYESIFALYEELIKRADGRRIILIGDSAGGGIALSLAYQCMRKNLKCPDRVILLSPWLDVSMTLPGQKELEAKDSMLGIYALKKCGELWAGNLDVKDPLPSPLYCTGNKALQITVFTGTHDILHTDAKALYRNAGKNIITYIEIPGAGHCYPLLPVKEAKEAVSKIEQILKN